MLVREIGRQRPAVVDRRRHTRTGAPSCSTSAGTLTCGVVAGRPRVLRERSLGERSRAGLHLRCRYAASAWILPLASRPRDPRARGFASGHTYYRHRTLGRHATRGGAVLGSHRHAAGETLRIALCGQPGRRGGESRRAHFSPLIGNGMNAAQVGLQIFDAGPDARGIARPERTLRARCRFR